MAPSAQPHILGIRHHGPGSARSVRQACDQLTPDIILVEGPPDAEDVLPLLAHPEMQPPVALLVYVPDKPHRAIYFPMALFSPEWQAIHYGLTHNIPVRFMDLPMAHQFVDDQNDETSRDHEGTVPNDETSRDHERAVPETDDETPDSNGIVPDEEETLHPRHDPLGFLAEAAGYSDRERWWDSMVEQRRDSTDLFAAIMEAMTAVRAEIPITNETEAQREAQREAYMRQTIRKAQKEGFERIVVVCGAWHAPALYDMPPVRQDKETLKGLPKVKVQATWVPWTYDRLAYRSGYGAGVISPGWYDHLFTSAQANRSSTDTAIYWMTRVAQLLRSKDLDASSAHVIESVRLAESLAALRDSPLPGLPEMNDAARSVFCYNSDMPMQLIHEQLIVGEKLGSVPEETPRVPLEQDIRREQKRLRLPADAAWKDIDLDLRKPNDLQRSHLIHRLNLLGIPWGEMQEAGKDKGTFHERWRIAWYPELTVKVIEAGLWGNTVESAATAFARHTADQIDDLPGLSALIQRVLLADLSNAIPHLTTCLQNRAALTSDVSQMMQALPSLTVIVRYGDVRQTDSSAVAHVIEGLISRICIGLPGACSLLDDDAAQAMFQHILAVNDALNMLNNVEYLKEWQRVLEIITNQQNIHGIVAGRCVRILLDQHVVDTDEAARRMGLSLSLANDPAYAAAWIEGFLIGSGAILVHDLALWQVIDDWVTGLADDVFQEILPLLRRTFSTFAQGERRNLGERARKPADSTQATTTTSTFDPSVFDTERADAALPLIAKLLGVE